jgi:hypothetical protein
MPEMWPTTQQDPKGTLREHQAGHRRAPAITRFRLFPSSCAAFVPAASRPRPLFPPCRSMVRRGSTVRVRQRASRNALQNGYLSCLSGKRVSRAGTRGHYLVFPRQAYRQVVFGLIKLIRTDLTPSVPRRDLAESARQIEMSGKGDAGVAHVQHGGDSFGEHRWSVVGAQPKRRVRRERRARQGSPSISRSLRAWLPPTA